MAGFYTNGNLIAAFTTDGDDPSIGYFTVTDASNFVVGATVSLVSDAVPAAQYQIGAVDETTNTIGVRSVYPGTPHLNRLNYGLTSIAQYLASDNAQVYQNTQFIYSNT